MSAKRLPKPLTPADCDLQDFKFMPLDVQRLRDSDLAAEQTPEENWAALLLWAASWHQIPSGSIPQKDDWLAKVCGYMMRGRIDAQWESVRAGAMRGYVLCSDGRLYHPVVCEKAREAWTAKLRARYDGLKNKIKVHNHRHKTAIEPPTFEAWLADGRPMGIPAVTVTAEAGNGYEGGTKPEQVGNDDTKRQGQGQGQGLGKEIGAPPPGDAPPPAPSAAPSPAPTPAPPAPAPSPAPGKTKAKGSDLPTVAAWAAYAEAYEARYGVAPIRNAKCNGQLANFVERVPAEEAPEIARFYVRHENPLYVRTMHPIDMLLRDAEGLRTQWKTGTVAPSRAAAARGETDWQRSQREAADKLTGGLASRKTDPLDDTNAPAPRRIARS